MSKPSSSFPILRTVSSMRRLRSSLPQPVALVPTMGMLHCGHVALVRLAAQRAVSVIVSVYVNPTQLAPGEQDTYPSTLSQDVEMLERLNEELQRNGIGAGDHQHRHHGRIVAVFAPTTEEMYPHSTELHGGRCGHVIISPFLTDRLEGKGLPAHFVGVTTVCLKLFVVVTPQLAVFGEKDYQQTIVVKRLVEEFLLDVEIVVAETVREVDGLAVSSRNVYIGPKRREIAVVLWRALRAGAETYRSGRRRRTEILGACEKETADEQERLHLMKRSDQVGFEVLYFGLSECQTLDDVEEVNTVEGAILSGAIELLPLENTHSADAESWDISRSVRLIDSIVLPALKSET